jgi:hypothetical protein
LGCPCLESGRDETDNGDYSNGIRELRRILSELIWILACVFIWHLDFGSNLSLANCSVIWLIT